MPLFAVLGKKNGIRQLPRYASTLRLLLAATVNGAFFLGSRSYVAGDAPLYPVSPFGGYAFCIRRFANLLRAPVIFAGTLGVEE